MHDFLVIVFFVMKKSIAVLYLISPTVAYIPVKSWRNSRNRDTHHPSLSPFSLRWPSTFAPMVLVLDRSQKAETGLPLKSKIPHPLAGQLSPTAIDGVISSSWSNATTVEFDSIHFFCINSLYRWSIGGPWKNKTLHVAF
jgi:hypothetical protein